MIYVLDLYFYHWEMTPSSVYAVDELEKLFTSTWEPVSRSKLAPGLCAGILPSTCKSNCISMTPHSSSTLIYILRFVLTAFFLDFMAAPVERPQFEGNFELDPSVVEGKLASKPTLVCFPIIFTTFSSTCPWH
jgi:hypothetical protein